MSILGQGVGLRTWCLGRVAYICALIVSWASRDVTKKVSREGAIRVWSKLSKISY